MSATDEKGPKQIELGKDEKNSPKSGSVKKEGRDLKSIKNRIPVLKLRKEKVSNQARFTGDGVAFKAKLIGVEEIDQARGDKLCQETLQRLKQVVKTSGTHKQRINLTISLSGVKLLEEKTGVVLYHHAVHQISFISQDMADDRAFGYICSPTPSIFHFVAIKTEKSASLIVLSLRDLFQAVLELKKQKLKQQPSKETEIDDSFDEAPVVLPSSSNQNVLDTSLENNSETEQAEEAIYAEVGQFVPQNAQKEGQVNEDVLKTANDLLCGDLLDLTFDEIQPIPMEAIFLDKHSLIQSNKEESVSEAHEITNDEGPKKHNQTFDKYSVFEEIDNVPSIFETTAPTNIFENIVPFSVNDQLSYDQTTTSQLSPLKITQSENFFANNSPVPDFQDNLSDNILLNSAAPPLFAELDPLGKDHPFIDKKVFFHEIKNPPRKNLKDMMSGNSSFDNSVSHSTPPSSGVSIFSNLPSTVPPPSYPPPVCANPFVSDAVCSSPPRVPPRVPFDVFNRESPSKGNPFGNSTDIELPPPCTLPPVLCTAKIEPQVSVNVFSVTKSPVLPKKVTKPKSDNGVFYNAPSASPPIVVSAAKNSILWRNSSVASNNSSEMSEYSSSWSASSKFNSDESNAESQKLSGEKFHSSEEIMHSENKSPTRIAAINQKLTRPNWSTFDLDDSPETLPTRELSENKSEYSELCSETSTDDKPEDDSVTLQVQTNMPSKAASPSFGSQIFGTSSAVDLPIQETPSPEENSIFKRKQDPFADEFFLSLAK